MSKSIVLFNFEDCQIRVVMDENGEPLFVAGDVCAVLDIADVSSAVSRLDDDQKGTVSVRTPGGMQAVLAVNESGLYALIFTSRKAQAKRFQKWITGEVLPAIRKTGVYIDKDLSALDILKQMVGTFEQQQRQITELNENQAQLAIIIDDMQAELLDNDYYTVLQWCQKQHIKECINSAPIRSKWGKECTALSTARNIEIKRMNEGSRNVGRYHKSILAKVCVAKPKVNDQGELL